MNLPATTIVDNRYEVIETLGEGGMGQVYLAREAALDRKVALKLLHHWLISDVDSRQRFHREAEIVSNLEHPNIGKFYRFGFWREQYPYFAMEFLPGKSLRQVLNDETKLEWTRALKIVAYVADAMEYAHKQGVVHRDLKPNNIIVTSQNNTDIPKILDFGLARVLKEEKQLKLTQTGELIGSIFYMSPEQCKGKSSDWRADIYALGCILFELLTGEPPLYAENPVAVIHLHANKPAPELPLAALGLPASLDKVMKKLLAKQPDERYQTMSNFREDLLSVLAGQEPMHADADATESSGKVKSAHTPRKKDGNPVYAISAVCVIAFLALALLPDPGLVGALSDCSIKLPSKLQPEPMAIFSSLQLLGKPVAADQFLQQITPIALRENPFSVSTVGLVLKQISKLDARGDLRSSKQLLDSVAQIYSKKVRKHLSPSESAAYCQLIQALPSLTSKHTEIIALLDGLEPAAINSDARRKYFESRYEIATSNKTLGALSFRLKTAEGMRKEDPLRAKKIIEETLNLMDANKADIPQRERLTIQVRMLVCLGEIGDRQSASKLARVIWIEIPQVKNMPNSERAAVESQIGAFVYSKTGNKAQGIEMLERAYDLAPNTQLGNHIAAELLARLGADKELDKAAEFLTKSLRTSQSKILQSSVPIIANGLVETGKLSKALDLMEAKGAAPPLSQKGLILARTADELRARGRVSQLGKLDERAKHWLLEGKLTKSEMAEASLLYANFLFHCDRLGDGRSYLRAAENFRLPAREEAIRVALNAILLAQDGRKVEAAELLMKNARSICDYAPDLINVALSELEKSAKIKERQAITMVAKELFPRLIKRGDTNSSLHPAYLLAVYLSDENEKKIYQDFLEELAHDLSLSHSVRSSAMNYRAMVLVNLRSPELYEWLHKSITFLEKKDVQNVDGYVAALYTAASYEAARANYAVAFPMLRKAYTEAIKRKRTILAAQMLWMEGDLRTRLGQYTQAASCFESSKKLLNPKTEPLEVASVLRCMEKLALAKGDHAETLKLARERATLEGRDPWRIFDFNPVLANTKLGRLSEAEKLLRAGEELTTERWHYFRFNRLYHSLAAAWLLRAKGNEPAAQKFFQKSLTEGTQLVMPDSTLIKYIEQSMANPSAPIIDLVNKTKSDSPRLPLSGS